MNEERNFSTKSLEVSRRIPFRLVADGIKRNVKNKLLESDIREGLDEIQSWVDKSIGTVHTFQGKEANTVYFVTGTDEKEDGAIDWSCSEPNLKNY